MREKSVYLGNERRFEMKERKKERKEERKEGKEKEGGGEGVAAGRRRW